MSSIKHPTFPILIVDDDINVLKSIEIIFKSKQINNYITCNDGRQVMQILNQKKIEVMLLDLSMPYISGLDLLPLIRQEYPEIAVIIITGSIDVTTAIACMKTGIFDYLVKAIEPSKLIGTVKRAIEINELKQENMSLQMHLYNNKIQFPEVFSEIITNNKSMLSIFMYIESIANTNQVVLITGETGVGKDLIAKTIHMLNRKEDSYQPVDIAGFDDNLFSDTLFGHEKGAFTGADRYRKGMIENASGGTIFLDEIGDLNIASQVKLLRLLESGEYYPLGSDFNKKMNVRIIAATNRNLQKLINEGLFRKDLYYRLSTHHIHIPPLRDRQDDLPLLINHFLENISLELGKKKPTPPPELYTLLGTYSFPGNIRELRSMMFDAISSHKSGILSLKSFKKVIGQQEIPLTPTIQKVSVTFPEKLPTLNQISWILIDEAVKRAKGNKSIAAGLLGISHQALSKRLIRGRG
jgi:DNA-binding NtrC family response regulator